MAARIYHPVRVVTQRTGLSPDLLRAWERRYRVVRPRRSEGGQRLYSDDDIERLRQLHRAVLAGRTIGQVAKLDRNALARLVEADSPGSPATGAVPDEDSRDLARVGASTYASISGRMRATAACQPSRSESATSSVIACSSAGSGGAVSRKSGTPSRGG
jgi:DNA-binding transcriptional MerR regulator